MDGLDTIFRAVANNRPYNNWGATLEFMRYYRSCKAVNPGLTLQEALHSFEPDPVALFDKYRSGNCVVVAAKLQHELSQANVDVALIGQRTGPIWARPPVPPAPDFPPLDWAEYDTATESVHHAAVVLRYTDTGGAERGKFFDAGTLENEDMRPYPSWGELERMEFNRYATRQHIANPGHVLKMQMRGRTKMVVTGRESSKQILGIDLIKGNLYVNRQGMEGIAGLPLSRGEDGVWRVSMEITALQRPEERAVYMVDKVPTEMTHREALDRLCVALRDRFQLPDDFATNTLTLAQNVDGMFDYILLEPCKTARATQGPVSAAAAQLEKAKKIVDDLKAVTEPSERQKLALTEARGIYKQADEVYKQIQDCVLKNRPEAIGSLIERLDGFYQQLVKINSSATGEPATLTLDLV
jgi:hypothetical protein